ncbi:MAG TPA: M23 family metallopeptidase [Longimicrobiales bacterium]|nr:M23 family metallopeptidase [Longimicrobiales bacterium]
MSRLGGVLVCAGALGCGGATGPELAEAPQTQAECLAAATFIEPATSPYCLPWAAGDAYAVGQSYCSPPPGSHQVRFAYDFLMPEGTEILNVRAGEVVELREHYLDDNRTGGQENMVSLRHDDETISIYMHLRHQGVAVQMGDRVPQGALIGWSGSTGDPSGVPHLHFQVCIRSGLCSYKAREITLPVNFRNAQGVHTPEGGLALGESYTADSCR